MAKYSFVELVKKNFDKKISDLIKNKHTKGLNITIPHKTNIIKHLGGLDKHSKTIGAVNCVLINKTTKGFNTDWSGYKSLLSGLGIKKTNKILILGCGGASRAIYYSLLKRNHNNILVFNREKKIINLENNKIKTMNFNQIEKHLTKASLIINTTPTNPLTTKQCTLIRAETILSDIVYAPKNTKFLKRFNKNKKIYGIQMLINQASLCFKIWFGFRPEADNALIEKLERKIQ